MSKILKEFTVITGTYTNSKGEQKNRYQTIGNIIDTKNGPMGKLDVFPIKEGGWNGFFYINDPRPREDKPKNQGVNQGFPPDDDLDF